MLIEDNQDDSEAIRRGFKGGQHNIPIAWFNSSHKALEHLNLLNQSKKPEDLPTLIMLDLNMPGIDGRELLVLIKQLSFVKHIPIIIFTTSADEKDVLQCYQNGASSYLQKPVVFKKLKEACETLEKYWYGIAITPKTDKNQADP